MNARVPTLPTPTTLRATSTIFESLEQMSPVVLQRGAVRTELVADGALELVGVTCPWSLPSSRAGTTIGGWLTIRY